MAETEKEATRFGSVVLSGLASAAVLVVSSAKDWARLDLPASARVGLTDHDLRADSPLALALALVVLAAWGVVLVSRRRARRFVLAIAVLADLGILACAARAPSVLPDQIRQQLALGHVGTSSPTGAYIFALGAALLSLLTLAEGLRYAPRWPEMSSRYDAPTTSGAEAVPATELADLELWKALDQGQDPTER